MRTVSVSRLKAHLAAHLRHVKAGERVVVTERGKPVAVMVPADQAGAGRVAELVARGEVRPGGAVPRAYWKLDRPADPDGGLLAAVLAERDESV